MKNRFKQLILPATFVGIVMSQFGCGMSDKIGAVEDRPNKISPYDVDFDSKSFSYNREKKTDGENPEEEQLLSDAQEAYDSGLYTLAREKWSRLKDDYPASFYVPFVELKIADSYYLGGDQAQAVSSYQEFIKLHPGHEAIPYVQLQIGRAYRSQYQGSNRDATPLQNAVKSLHVLVENFPQSEYTTEGWKLIVECRELLAEYEFGIAQFYERTGKTEAMRARYAELLANYGDTDVVKNNIDIISRNFDRAPDIVAAIDKPVKKQAASPAPSAPNILLASDEPEPADVATGVPTTRTAMRQAPTRLSGGATPVSQSEAVMNLTCGESSSTQFVTVVPSDAQSKLTVSESAGSRWTICPAEGSTDTVRQSCGLSQTRFSLEPNHPTGCIEVSLNEGSEGLRPTVITTTRPNRVVIIFPKS